MGSGSAKGFKITNYEQLLYCLSLKSMPDYMANYKSLAPDLLNQVSIIPKNDSARRTFYETFLEMKKNNCFDPAYLPLDNKQIQRCVASFLGLGICDALGASTQFIPYDPKGLGVIKVGFADIEAGVKCGLLQARHGTIDVWTDDCSMALAMSTSLILNKGNFVPKHVRYMFTLWICNGLNNGGRKHSIGLGGNIKISIEEFFQRQTDFCEQGSRFNNGNGSLMRLAPIPIRFRNNLEDALRFSAESSRTTHNGEEAKQCCRLLTWILIRLYKRKDSEDPKKVLAQACQDFPALVQSVSFLARSQQQPELLFLNSCLQYGKNFKNFNKSLADRNWNWKDPNFQYSPTRAADKPGYVGSYCMDALAMALHTVWKSNSFLEVAILNANLGGDADTVGAIAGQIAGAMYGIDKQMLRLYSQMSDFKIDRYELLLQAFKLTQL